MTALGILWFVLIAVLICGYFVLDGMDLGVGVLYPVLGKTETDKRLMMRSIGPVWDGNEVWLLTAGHALLLTAVELLGEVVGTMPLCLLNYPTALALNSVCCSLRFLSRNRWYACLHARTSCPRRLPH